MQILMLVCWGAWGSFSPGAMVVPLYPEELVENDLTQSSDRVELCKAEGLEASWAEVITHVYIPMNQATESYFYSVKGMSESEFK